MALTHSLNALWELALLELAPWELAPEPAFRDEVDFAASAAGSLTAFTGIFPHVLSGGCMGRCLWL